MFERIYVLLPVFAQNWACSLYGYLERRRRFSSHFEQLHHEMLDYDKKPISELNELQSIRLVEILKFARENTRFYKDYIPSHISVSNVREILSTLPILSKKDIQAQPSMFESSLPDKVKAKTSGSSGKGFSFYKCKRSIASQWAVWYRHRGRFGVSEGDLHVNFMGKPVVPQNSFPFWRRNAAFNQYIIPMQVINSGNIESILRFLNSISPSFYSGYPSIISEVARIALEQGYSLESKCSPKFVFTGAEPLLDTQKELIEKWTGAMVSQQYGMTEGVCNISECEHGSYHEDMEFGFIEKLNPVRNKDGSVTAEIVGTSFYNEAQPFLRYKTGDFATWEPESFRCECGRSSPVIRAVEGRIEDYVALADGRRIMRFDYLFKSVPEIEEAQVIQRCVGEIEIHYTSEKEIDFDEILRQVKKFIGGEIRVKFQRVASISREPNGKFRSVKSFLNKVDR